MTDYKTMRVPVDAWEDAKERKEAAGLTWGEWLEQARVDNDSTEPADGADVDLKRVMNRLDDLETRLPTKVAEELQR